MNNSPVRKFRSLAHVQCSLSFHPKAWIGDGLRDSKGKYFTIEKSDFLGNIFTLREDGYFQQ